VLSVHKSGRPEWALPDTDDLMVITGWRAALLLAFVLLVAVVFFVAVFWLGILLGVLAAVAWFNLVLLPRLAVRIRAPEPLLAGALLPLLCVGGFLISGTTGVFAAAVIWALGVAVPRVVVWRLRRRALRVDPGSAGTDLEQIRVIEGEFRQIES